MLSPRLTNCPECANIPSLLRKIDCKLAELGNNLYNNISYMLNKPVPADDILQLIGYRRILQYKYINPNYVHVYSVNMIASRVIRLTVGCVSRCNEPAPCLEVPCDITIVPNPTTTSTSTLAPITTTTSSSSTSTTTSTSSSSSTSTTTTSSSSSTTTTTTTVEIFPIQYCVWSSTDYQVPQISAYNVGTNTLVPVPIDNNLTGFPTGTCTSSEKLWKHDPTTNTIREWFINSYPASLTFNRDITYQDEINFVTSAPVVTVDNNTILTTRCVTSQTYPSGIPGEVYLLKYDISTNDAGVGTSLFKIRAAFYAASMMFTTDNKLIVSTFRKINNVDKYYLTQYSYPDGFVEADISLESISFNSSAQLKAFYVITYNSEIYLIRSYDSSLFKIDTTYPYAITEVTANLGFNQFRQFGSSTGECNNVSFTPEPSECCTLSDVTIGTQTWTACNLNVDTYRNGDPIPQATSASEWNELTTGAWCYYNFDAANECIYGKQYNWHAVNDPRGLAPVGYHVPDEAEWNLLGTFLGGASVAGAELKQTGTTLWNAPNTGATNSTGWTGLPSGYTSYFGTFDQLGQYGTFWSSQDYAPNGAWRRYLSFNNILLQRNGARKDTGMAVRLIKDPVATTTTTTLAPTGFNTIYTHFESL